MTKQYIAAKDLAVKYQITALAMACNQQRFSF